MHGTSPVRVNVRNELVIIGSKYENKVQVLTAETDRLLWEFDHGDTLSNFIVRDDWVITCCRKSVRVLRLDNGEELHRLDHPSECNKADLCPNKSILAVACDAVVVIWDMKRVVKMKQFELVDDSQPQTDYWGENPPHMFRDLRFNPSGDKLIVGSLHGRVFNIQMK